jgi:flagellar basal body-associated protein FliL
METLLIAIALMSLVLALAMSVVAWRATQGEKQRAAARVAALAAASGVDPVDASGTVSAAEPLEPAPWRSPGSLTAGRPHTLEAEGPSGLHAVVEAPAPGSVSVHTGFLGAESPIRESQQHQWWLRLAAAVLALVLGGVIFARMSHRGSEQATAQSQAAPAPLELLSLRHDRQGVNLSVAGLVRNPPAGNVLERVTAVVYLFDQQGAFVTSAKAPIDFLKLTGGDESPFVVKVAAPTSVARYRVSFRTDDGTLAHVDRRGEPPVALTRSEK